MKKIIIIALVLVLIVTGALFYDQVIVRPQLMVESVSHKATTINLSGGTSGAAGDTIAIQFSVILTNKSFTQGLKDVEVVYTNPDSLPPYVVGRKLGKTVTPIDLPARTINKKITMVALVQSDGSDIEKIIKELESVSVNIATKKQNQFVKASKPILLMAK